LLQFDENKVIYSGEFTGQEDSSEMADLQKFITMHSLPLVVEFNQDTAQKIFSGEIKSHLLVFLNKEAGHFAQYVDVIREVAKKYRGQVWRFKHRYFRVAISERLICYCKISDIGFVRNDRLRRD
jgi:hypothetical protein